MKKRKAIMASGFAPAQIATPEADAKNRSNYLVGVFSLGGSFAPIVGIGLSRWLPDSIGQ
jgi:hypothetical protein